LYGRKWWWGEIRKVEKSHIKVFQASSSLFHFHQVTAIPKT
jgi:hypothetical protein